MPPGTVLHIGKAKKEVRIKSGPEELVNRLASCDNLDEAVAREYKTTRAARLTRDNIGEIAKKLGVDVEMTALMGSNKVESLSLRQLDRKGVKAIIAEDIDRDSFNIMEVCHQHYSHITGAGVFIGGDSKPDGVLMAEECFLLL